MKTKLSGMWRSGIAMLLALCLVVGMSPVAFAASEAATEPEWEDLVEDVVKPAAEQAWDYLNDPDHDYVGIINSAIESVKEAVGDRYAYYENVLTAIANSVVELEDEKAALVAELADLNDALEAKKAELDKALADHKVGDIVIPGVDLSVNNEKNEAAQFECDHENGDCAAITELKAAIEHIEHAITTVENLIEDVEGDINAVLELVTKIEAAVEAYGETAESVEAAADDLAEAVAAAVAVLTNMEDTTDAAIAAYNAARETVLAAAAVLEDATAVAEELAADVEALLPELTDAAEKLSGLASEDLAKLEDLINENNTTENRETAIKVALAVAKQEVYDKLDAEQQAAIADYAAKIQNAEIDLEEVKDQIKEEIAKRYPAVEEAIKAEYAQTIEALENKKAALEAELGGYKAELAELGANAAEELTAPIKAQIERVTNDIAVVDADLEAALGHLNAALAEAYKALVAEVEAAYQATVESIEKTIADLKAECEAAVKALKDAAEKEIADLVAEAEKQLAALKALAEDVAELIESVYTAVNEEIAAAKAAVEGILDGSIKTVEDLKNALGELGDAAVETIEAAVDELTNAIKAAFGAATTADLFVDDTFKYVAIGDGSAETASYVEKLNSTLVEEAVAQGMEAKNCILVNNAKKGNTVAAERANLSDVTDADLVTVGFSHVAFLDDAINGRVDMDWASVVGEENVSYVDKLLDEVNAKVEAAELPAGMQTFAMGIVEAYAFSAVQYATELPELINDIKAANPDAVVVIVGMYNPFKGVTFALDDGPALDISEYIDYLVTGVAVHGTAYAMLTGNAIYVDAPAAATILGEKTITMADFATTGIINLVSNLYPSAEGDDYIAEKLADALDIYYKAEEPILWGDADGNGEIQTNDAKLILQYCAEMIGENGLDLTVCDVDGSGKIQTNDAKLILQYCADMISKFPVE